MLKTFTDYLVEAEESSLSVFDVDDTLFRTTTKVYVKKGGKRIRSLTPAEFNVYKLKTGEELDFSEFRSAAIFHKTAQPVETVFKTAKKMLKNFTSPKKKFIIVTARADLDDRELFLSTFRKYGFDINRVHVYRADNIDAPGAEAKKSIIRDQIKKGEFTIVRMFDDAEKNLRGFLELKQEFPNINFEAFYIHENGRITRFV
jgi:hypothetical protein